MQPLTCQPKTPLTARLLEDGSQHLVLDEPVAIDCPVRLLHGLADPDVPWQRSLALADCVTARDVRITLLKHGEHRLSEPDELDLLARELRELVDLARKP